ncbi:hypothetical protein ACFQMA_23340 [Halosimplex aquaticum]|uniref:Nudix hydrolase domain-containing protein n=1 Tax=Halosimplex aquaticum TaxID=3026162 RepID=A0ABD5YB59_9EURY|nr:hypothetical protein [Halosimplex aquaticum]
MPGIRDPEALRDAPGVEFREQERVVGEAEFETVAEGAENQSGLVVVGLTSRDGHLLLIDSEYIDGWTLPNGPVGVDEDWAIAADRWSEEAIGIPIDIGAPELVVRTETRTEDGDESVVGYSVAFGASLLRGMEGSGMGPASETPPGAGPAGSDGSGGDPAAGSDDGEPPGPADIAERPDLAWFSEVPEDAAPGHDALIRFFLD